MRVGRDGKWRPNAPPRTLEDQSDELVTSADSGPVEPSQMRIGLVVGETLDREELQRLYGGKQTLGSVEFEEKQEDGSVTVTRMEADGTLTVLEQKPAAPPASQREPRRRGKAMLESPDQARPGKCPKRFVVRSYPLMVIFGADKPRSFTKSCASAVMPARWLRGFGEQPQAQTPRAVKCRGSLAPGVPSLTDCDAAAAEETCVVRFDPASCSLVNTNFA